MIVQVECKQVFQTKRALLYAEVELFLKSKGGGTIPQSYTVGKFNR